MISLDPETSLNVKQIVRAPREKVFDAFVIPELRKQWWAGGPGNRCTVCEIDARVGGDYRINMLGHGTEYVTVGTFKEFSRPDKLVFTWSWDKAINGAQTLNSVVTVVFKAIDATTTEISLTHELLPDAASRDNHANGWAGCIGSLVNYLENGIGDLQKHFQRIVQINAPPEKVFEAITTSDGLKGWWTTDCNIGSREGEFNTFRFGKTWKEFRIEKLVPKSEVRWLCTQQHFDASHNLKNQSEWVGTSVLFQLGDNGKGGTRLVLQHIGFTPQFECYEICQQGWHHFVGISLKQFAESGKGQPFVAETMSSCNDVERPAV